MSAADSEPTLAAISAQTARKAERQRPLIDALASTPAESGGAREQLEQLLDRETLNELDARTLALVTGEDAPEPERGFLDGVASAQEAQRRRLVDGLLGRRTPDPAATDSGSLDGGVCTTPARPQTHEQWLAGVLRDRKANVGSRL